MNHRLTVLAGLSSTALLWSIWGTAFGLVGRAPVIPESCTLSQAAAELGPDGTVRYNVTGTCAGTPITGQMAYAPNQQMSERFFFRGAEFRTTALCPADPWVTGVQCEDQKVAAKGADPGPLIHAPVPLSRVAIGAAQVFQNARTNASHPKPPGPPVNAKATMRFGTKATVSWLGPDQRGNFGPYLNFIVEARPKQAEGAAWVKLGGIPRHSAPDYRLTVQLPPTVAGTTGWELRACAATVLASTCTGPIAPTITAVTEREMRAGPKDKIAAPPSGNVGVNAVREFPKDTVTPPPAPPKKLPDVTQSPSVAQKSTLKPQPLPPKSLRAPILRRGVEQESAPQEETKPAP